MTRYIPSSKAQIAADAAGHRAACEELARTPCHMLDPANPNHPINDGLFGYEREAFMARQYRKTLPS